MARYNITDYSATWDFDQHYGRFVFYWEDENNPGPDIANSNWLYAPRIYNPAEFQVMIDLLRNENPISYDSNTKRLMTGKEPPGEGEDRR
jgi:hypothetical protein